MRRTLDDRLWWAAIPRPFLYIYTHTTRVHTFNTFLCGSRVRLILYLYYHYWLSRARDVNIIIITHALLFRHASRRVSAAHRPWYYSRVCMRAKKKKNSKITFRFSFVRVCVRRRVNLSPCTVSTWNSRLTNFHFHTIRRVDCRNVCSMHTIRRA